MVGCDVYYTVTSEWVGETKEPRRGRTVHRTELVGRNGTGYPSLDGLELCVASRATQTTDNDYEMGQPHRHHECQH